jgi:hypothetical protein
VSAHYTLVFIFILKYYSRGSPYCAYIHISIHTHIYTVYLYYTYAAQHRCILHTGQTTHQPRVCFSHLTRSFPCGCQHCSSRRRLPAPCSPSAVRRHSIYKLALELGLDSQVGMGARSNVRASFLSGALDRVSARASGVSICCASRLLGSRST